MIFSKTQNIRLNSMFSNSILELHILPTEKCNFRCVYCYENFNIGKMPEHIIQGIKNLLSIRIKDLKILYISWFGGEPLAATKIILEINNFAKNLCEQNNCKYKFSITTNGYILNIDIFSKLVNSGIKSWQISLDGDEKEHNKTRLRADKKGTFKKIWNNLINAAKTKYKFSITLRIHITPQNYKTIPILLQKIAMTFKQDPRFQVFLKAIEDLGGPNTKNFQILTGKSKQQIIKKLNFELKKLSINKKKYFPENPICYAAKQNSWIIRADGSLAKCSVMFNDNRNKIGNINENGTLTIDNNKLKLWLRGTINNNFTTMSCPAYKIPKLTKNIEE